MIEVRHLYKSFGDKEVLKDINFKFEDGKTNLIIGQSGSGKTVLMKNLVGLLDPTSGEVLYDGRDFVKMTKQEKVAMRREMGMIFQSAALFDSLSLDDYFITTYTKPAVFDTISTYVVNATKGARTEIKTALWALSCVIFCVVVFAVVVMNIRAGRKRHEEKK